NVPENKTLADVEIRIPAFPSRIGPEEPGPAVIIGSQVGRRLIIKGMAPGVTRNQGDPVGEAFFSSRLKGVVAGISRGAEDADRRVDHGDRPAGSIGGGGVSSRRGFIAVEERVELGSFG